MAYAENTAGLAEKTKDTIDLIQRLESCVISAQKINEMAEAAVASLWGHLPPENSKDGPMPVQNGFFGEAQGRVTALQRVLDEILQKISRLRAV